MKLPCKILGTGFAVPATVRENSYWPRLSAHLGQEGRDVTAPPPARLLKKYPGAELVLRHMGAVRDDPFRGAQERRVLEPERKLSDLQIEAAQEALARSGTAPEEVELVLDFSLPNDLAAPLNSGVIQHGVGAVNAMSFSVDSGCSSFVTMLSVAARHVATGTRRVLGVLGAAQSRLLSPDEPASPTLGDGAAAFVLGPDPTGQGGLTGYYARNDGRLHPAIVLSGESGRPWYSACERLRMEARDARLGMEVVLRAAEAARTAIGGALAQAGLPPGEVDFFFSHQPMAWFPGLSREAAGLTHARLVESFRQYGSLAAASALANLHLALREGAVRPGDDLVLYSNGAGFNYTAAVLRWA